MSSLEIASFLDRPAARRYALRVLVLCGLLSAVEGIDIYIVASILPVLAKIYGVRPAAFAAVFVAQGIGQALGSYFGAPLADHIGRRPVILTSVAAFGALTLAAVLATSVPLLAAVRMLALFFVGAAQPNLFALAGEFAAPAHRHRFLLAIGSIHALGAGLAAMLSAWLIGFSWRMPLEVCAAGTLILAAIAWKALPESLAYLVAHADSHRAKIRAAIRRIDATQSMDGAEFLAAPASSPDKGSIRSLFVAGRARNTLLLWLCAACSLPLLTTIGQWLPTFLHVYGGRDVTSAAAMTSVSGIVAALWPLLLMLVMDKVGVARGVALNLVAGAISLLSFAWIGSWPTLGWFIGFSFGAFVAGSVTGVYALAAQSYATPQRATGIGWSMGAGRIVAIVLPSLGGAALAFQATSTAVAMGVAVPLLIGACAAYALRAYNLGPQRPQA